MRAKNHSINCKDINNLNTTIDKNHKKRHSTLVQPAQCCRDQRRSSPSSPSSAAAPAALQSIQSVQRGSGGGIKNEGAAV